MWDGVIVDEGHYLAGCGTQPDVPCSAQPNDRFEDVSRPMRGRNVGDGTTVRRIVHHNRLGRMLGAAGKAGETPCERLRTVARTDND
jgi:hypothetical protein